MKKEDLEKLKINAGYEAEQAFASVRAAMTKPTESQSEDWWGTEDIF